ncbi:hypothetical protein [Tropicibacter sp. Alg240-R139]|uniref:hypothetical protein n=1 Tax=Tropicibacter sp. Alg240-R139 TaxID=2305991 RepID=UPI0013E07374|nr:hypothetical protein [Tropicibacter sp. Alg240-R139]
MNKPLAVLLIAGLTLSACNSWSNSRVNPTNWFGGSTSAPIDSTATASTNPLIPASRRGIFARPEEEDRSIPITNVTELQIDPSTSGAIIQVVGVAKRQGAYDAELRLTPAEDDEAKGVLTYTFYVTYPEDPTPQGAERTRTIRQAISLSRQDLQNIRLIRVIGQENVRESRRRG